MPLCGFMPQGCVNIGSEFTERLSKWGKFFQLGFFFSAAGTKGERKRVQMKGEEEEEMNGGTAKVATLRKAQIQWFPIRPGTLGVRPLLPPLFLQCASPVIS